MYQATFERTKEPTLSYWQKSSCRIPLVGVGPGSPFSNRIFSPAALGGASLPLSAGNWLSLHALGAAASGPVAPSTQQGLAPASHMVARAHMGNIVPVKALKLRVSFEAKQHHAPPTLSSADRVRKASIASVVMLSSSRTASRVARSAACMRIRCRNLKKRIARQFLHFHKHYSNTYLFGFVGLNVATQISNMLFIELEGLAPSLQVCIQIRRPRFRLEQPGVVAARLFVKLTAHCSQQVAELQDVRLCSQKLCRQLLIALTKGLLLLHLRASALGLLDDTPAKARLRPLRCDDVAFQARTRDVCAARSSARACSRVSIFEQSVAFAFSPEHGICDLRAHSVYAITVL